MALVSLTSDEVDEACRWLHEWLEGVTYRPGWRFFCHIVKVMATDPGRVGLTAEFTSRCVNTPKVFGVARMNVVGTERDVTGVARLRDEALVARFLDDMVAEIEGHERLEHLRRAGVPLHDPHPPGSPPRTRPPHGYAMPRN